MTAKEIKDGMSKNTWLARRSDGINVHPEDGSPSWYSETASIYPDGENTKIGEVSFYTVTNGLFVDNKREFEANTEAVLRSINNTYGKGIDPEKVPEMVELLRSISRFLTLHPAADTTLFAGTIVDINNLLNSAKI